MYLGRLIEYGPKDDIFSDPKHPYTKALLDSFLTPDPTQDVPEIALGRGFPNPLDPPTGCAFHPRCARVMDVCSKVRPEQTVVNGIKLECHLYPQIAKAAE
jgi:peptide/nickel transport system ATP-binding protein